MEATPKLVNVGCAAQKTDEVGLLIRRTSGIFCVNLPLPRSLLQINKDRRICGIIPSSPSLQVSVARWRTLFIAIAKMSLLSHHFGDEVAFEVARSPHLADETGHVKLDKSRLSFVSSQVLRSCDSFGSRQICQESGRGCLRTFARH